QANIARAEGIRQANVLQAQGEAQAITTIDEQLRQSPSYLEWLKSQKWNGHLPLVVGSGGAGQSVTPFIEIPTSRSELGSQAGNSNSTAALASGLAGGGDTLQDVLNNTLLTNATR
ncbi:MAG TPA: hypothetical protein VE130_16920, partial [Nitrososphaeraceae archaeon]|nr:hypothetical protein [Nitrososphaeraceae archaeon]